MLWREGSGHLYCFFGGGVCIRELKSAFGESGSGLCSTGLPDSNSVGNDSV